MTRDGRMKHPLYVTWMQLKQRCDNPNNPKYKNCGGRGIKLCPSWLDFWQFVADMGQRPTGTTLDRIDIDGNYCKENCRWADKFTQAHNVRRSLTGYIVNVQKYRPKKNLTKPWRAEYRRYGKRIVEYFSSQSEASSWLNNSLTLS